jgi:hypothetical protein
MVASVEESRTTWLLFAVIALSARLAEEQPDGLAACFPARAPTPPEQVTALKGHGLSRAVSVAK